MKFTDLFIKRPVLAIVVNLVILIAGLQAIRALSVRQYPRSDISVVRVATIYVGAKFLQKFLAKPEVLVGVLAHEVGHRPKRWRHSEPKPTW